MGLFDSNTQHPIETLYDQCKEIVNYIVPMNLMHYNGSCNDMERDIITMLKERNLFIKTNSDFDNEISKISGVDVRPNGYINRIPTYIVSFYYVKYHHSNLWINGKAVEFGAFFTQFTVGINGIIHEPV